MKRFELNEKSIKVTPPGQSELVLRHTSRHWINNCSIDSLFWIFCVFIIKKYWCRMDTKSKALLIFSWSIKPAIQFNVTSIYLRRNRLVISKDMKTMIYNFDSINSTSIRKKIRQKRTLIGYFPYSCTQSMLCDPGKKTPRTVLWPLKSSVSRQTAQHLQRDARKTRRKSRKDVASETSTSAARKDFFRWKREERGSSRERWRISWKPWVTWSVIDSEGQVCGLFVRNSKE